MRIDVRKSMQAGEKKKNAFQASPRIGQIRHSPCNLPYRPFEVKVPESCLLATGSGLSISIGSMVGDYHKPNGMSVAAIWFRFMT